MISTSSSPSCSGSRRRTWKGFAKREGLTVTEVCKFKAARTLAPPAELIKLCCFGFLRKVPKVCASCPEGRQGGRRGPMDSKRCRGCGASIGQHVLSSERCKVGCPSATPFACRNSRRAWKLCCVFASPRFLASCVSWVPSSSWCAVSCRREPSSSSCPAGSRSTPSCGNCRRHWTAGGTRSQKPTGVPFEVPFWTCVQRHVHPSPSRCPCHSRCLDLTRCLRGSISSHCTRWSSGSNSSRCSTSRRPGCARSFSRRTLPRRRSRFLTSSL